MDKGLKNSLALGFDPSSPLLPLLSVCRNHTPKHKTRLEYGVFVEAAALFLGIPFQQLTLEKVVPIDTMQGSVSEGPWDCLGMVSGVLECHLRGKRL